MEFSICAYKFRRLVSIELVCCFSGLVSCFRQNCASIFCSGYVVSIELVCCCGGIVFQFELSASIFVRYFMSIKLVCCFVCHAAFELSVSMFE